MRMYLANLLATIPPEIGVLIYLTFFAQFQHRNISRPALLDRPIHCGSKVFGMQTQLASTNGWSFHKTRQFFIHRHKSRP